jgi:hypothetical protein
MASTTPPPPVSGTSLKDETACPQVPANGREKLATFDLEDSDIVGVAVAPIKSAPPPLVRKSSVPPAAPSARPTVPPPPQSAVVVSKSTPVPNVPHAVKTPTPARAFTPPPPPASFAPPIPIVAPVTQSVAPVPRSVVPAPPASVVPAPSFPPPSAVVAPPVSVAPPPVSVAPPAAAVAPAANVRPVTQPVPQAQAAPVRAATQSSLRLSVNDPTDLIFDGMYGLSFARSRSEAAEMVAETLAKALGARTVVIHTHDLITRELRAIACHGDGDFDIIGSAETSDDDLVGSAVICNEKSVTMKFDGELPRLAPKRLHAVGAPRSLVAAPAMSWGRCLAMIEVIDADERFAARVADALAYVAEQFAQFLSHRAA